MWSFCGPQPRPFADLDGHGAAHHVARREILGGGRVALHEALAFGIGEIAALAARALGDEAAGAVDAGRVELDELHVLQRQPGAQHHGIAVAGAGMRRGAGEIGAAIAAGRQHHHVRAEAVQGAVLEVPGQDAAADALLVHDEIEGEILDEELGVVLQALLVERVDDGMAGAVGRGVGALCHRPAAILRRVAAEGPLIDPAILGARERHAEMLELDHRGDRLAAHVFDGVLVAEPVGALDRVVHVPAPVVLAHIAERGGDAALSRDGVAARREDLGDAGGLQSRRGHAERGAQTGAAGADDDDVIEMLDDRIGLAASLHPWKAMRSTAKMPVMASTTATALLSKIADILTHSVWT